jgi:hypothetical protein
VNDSIVSHLQCAEALRAILDGSTSVELRIGQRRVDFEAPLQHLSLMERGDFVGVERRTIEEQVLVIAAIVPSV